MYAFGVLLYELLSCTLVLRGLTNTNIMVKLVLWDKVNWILPMNPEWPAELRTLLLQCLAFEAQDRPSMRGVVNALDAMAVADDAAVVAALDLAGRGRRRRDSSGSSNGNRRSRSLSLASAAAGEAAHHLGLLAASVSR